MLERIFPGDGELAARMRAHAWSGTSLGDPVRWSPTLRALVRGCLASPAPMSVWWGPSLTLLYNDATIPLLGRRRHPRALGGSARDAWPEIGDILGDHLRSASADVTLLVERGAWMEEVHATFSLSAIDADDGAPGGLLCTCADRTRLVFGEGRAETTRRLGTLPVAASEVEAARDVVGALAEAPDDVAFAAIYLMDDDRARMVAACGPTGALPLDAAVDVVQPALWPIARTIALGRPHDVNVAPLGLRGRDLVRSAVVLPLADGGASLGALVVGLDPRRPADERYRSFLDVVAVQAAAAVARARERQRDRRRADAMADRDRGKTTLLGNVSHELRTPLTLVLLPLEEALAGLEPTDPLEPLLSTAHRNAVRLLRLVNATLDFSRLEAGSFKAVYFPVDLARLTRELASGFEDAIEHGGLRLVVDAPPLPAPVYVDPSMWETIVLNLLSNALKFTLEGTITVRVLEEDGRAVLRVSDTGIGVPADEVPRLFERFHRVEGARGRTREGAGLGLSLVAEMVRLHGGAVSVSSVEGEGSTFSVALPFGAEHLDPRRVRADDAPALGDAVDAWLAEAARWLPASDVVVASPPAPEGAARILVAEDNADLRAYLVRLLSDRWFVDAVGDGATALVAARAGRFDLVIADVAMPGLDGHQLLAALRREPSLEDLPVILLSARAELQVDGLLSGADDYVVKPFATSELTARVARQLRRSERRDPGSRALGRLHQVSRDLRSDVPVPGLLGRVNEAAIALTRATAGVVHVYDPEQRALRAAATSGLGAVPVGSLDAGEHEASVPGEAFRRISRVVAEDLTIPTGPPLDERWVEGMLESGVRSLQSTPMVARDGRVVGLITTMWTTPVPTDASSWMLVDVLAREAADALDHRRREEALVAAREEASRALRAKDEFVGGLAHELRNPISPILTTVEILKLRGAESAETRTIERQARQLAAIVDDLLDVSRIVEGRIALDRRPESVAEVVARAIDQARPAIEAREHHLQWTVEPGLTVEGDAGRLVQVLRNLLTHAARQGSGLRIDLDARREDGRVVLVVADDGAGFSRELLPRIFEPFSARRDGAAGLGLAIVRSLVRMHGGTIEASSPGPGHGSMFTIRLPAGDAVPVVRAPASRRVLVVDDDPAIVVSLCELLRTAGHAASGTRDGATAVVAARLFRPEVAVLDIGLPRVDGYEIARRLRAEHPNLRLVALTAYGSAEDRRQGLEAGFDVYLAKPVNAAALLRALEAD